MSSEISEILMTYGWCVIIVVLVVVGLWALGVFDVPSFPINETLNETVTQECVRCCKELI